MQTTKNNKQRRGTPARGNTAELIAQLGSRNGMERQHARAALARLGTPAIGPLTAALSADRNVIRWEAAKVFTALHAPEAAPALVKALDDEDSDVRWLAAEALIGLRKSALAPLFEALMARAGSIELREGAHHILRAFNHDDLADIVDPVLKTLEHYEPELAVPFSAEEALAKLKKRQV
ncbi:MAG: HEAT repeat domain-containing protein [Phycisphaerae bacterium]|jgi:HEAT repeat protein